MSAPALRPLAPPTGPSSAADLSPAERVAVVLSLLEPDQARALAAGWSPQETDRVVAAYEAMGALPRPVVLEVVAAFVAELSDATLAVRGGARGAAALAGAIARAEAAEAPEAPAELPPDAPPEAVWAHVASLPKDALLRLVRGERPAVAAAVIGQLPAPAGAALLAALDEEAAVVAALRLAAPGLAPGTMDAIAEALREQAQAGAAAPGREDAGAGAVTGLLARCPQGRQDAILEALREGAPTVADEVERTLLRFGSLPERLPRTAVPLLFREVPQETLDTALRHGAEAQPEAVDFLYGCVAQRLAEQIRERASEGPPPTRAAGEAAQAEVVGMVLAWAAEGRVTLAEG